MIAVKQIFEGSKFFWRTRNTVDVLIVEHKAFDVFEVITYEPIVDKEGSRIYLSGWVVRAEIDHHEINNKLSFAMRNNVPMTEKFVESVHSEAISIFVLQRLAVAVLNIEGGQFEMKWNPSSADSVPNLIVPCPAGLEPHITKHSKLVMHEVVVQAMKEFEDMKQSLHDACTSAAKAEVAVAETLSAKQRWRMPIVMTKVFSNKKLNIADTRIFRHMQNNMKTDDDVKRIYATVMRKPKPASFTTSLPSSRPSSRPNGTSSPPSALSTAQPTPRTHQSVANQPTARRESRSLYANTQSSLHRHGHNSDDERSGPRHSAQGRVHHHGEDEKSGRTAHHSTPNGARRGSHGSDEEKSSPRRSGQSNPHHHGHSSAEDKNSRIPHHKHASPVHKRRPNSAARHRTEAIDEDVVDAPGAGVLLAVVDTIGAITSSLQAAVSGKHRSARRPPPCPMTTTCTDVDATDAIPGTVGAGHVDDVENVHPTAKLASPVPTPSTESCDVSSEQDRNTPHALRPKALTTRRSLLGTVLQALTSTMEGALSWGTGASSNNNNTRKVAVVG